MSPLILPHARRALPDRGHPGGRPHDAILLEVTLGARPTEPSDQLADRGILLLLDQGRSQRFMRRGDTLRQDSLLDLTAPDLSWGARQRDRRVETPGH